MAHEIMAQIRILLAVAALGGASLPVAAQEARDKDKQAQNQGQEQEEKQEIIRLSPDEAFLKRLEDLVQDTWESLDNMDQNAVSWEAYTRFSRGVSETGQKIIRERLDELKQVYSAAVKEAQEAPDWIERRKQLNRGLAIQRNESNAAYKEFWDKMYGDDSNLVLFRLAIAWRNWRWVDGHPKSTQEAYKALSRFPLRADAILGPWEGPMPTGRGQPDAGNAVDEETVKIDKNKDEKPGQTKPDLPGVVAPVDNFVPAGASSMESPSK